MKILFLGNNRLGWKVADWLRKQNEDIVALVVHPKTKRKFGNEIIRSSKVKRSHIFDGSALQKEKVINSIKKLKPDIAVSVCFGFILEKKFLQSFPGSCINLHTAFLPYNRGSCPNVWSIVDNTPAGATIHYMDEGIDSGAIIARKQIAVSSADTGASLYQKLEDAAFRLFKNTWPSIRSGRSRKKSQKKSKGTNHRLKDLSGIDKIDLNRKYQAKQLINIVRARTFPPYAGAYYVENGKKIYLRLQLLDEKDLKKENGLH